VHFFVHSRAAPGAAEPGDALTEAHWTYMDAFADGMIARGPTLGPDRESWTGSVHIVDLPSAEAAHEFVHSEPYNRAGLFGAHVIRRFTNLLGRTMWESPAASDDPLFLAIANEPLPAPRPERLVVHGELEPAGVVLALHAPSRDALGLHGAEIHDWERGGRR
jgi:hypothetical protein